MQDEIGADLEVAVARSKKEDLERGEEEAMKASAACTSLLSGQAVAEAAWGSGDAHVQSTATRRPRLQAFGARGAPNLALGFAAKPSPSAPWARGLLSASWERGSPDLPARGPQRGWVGRSVRPIFIDKAIKTFARGHASRGGRNQDLPGGGLARLVPRSGDIYARCTL